MSPSTSINTEFFHFSLRKVMHKEDVRTLEAFIKQGANPNLVVNGQHILCYFNENQRQNMVEALLPLCNWEQRFGKGTSLLGWCTHKLIDAIGQNATPKMENYSRIFLQMVDWGASPHQIAQTEFLPYREECLKLVFDAAQMVREVGSVRTHILKDFFIALRDREIFPHLDEVDSNSLIAPPSLPIFLNAWWADYCNYCQRQRLRDEIQEPFVPEKRTKKI